MGGGSKVETRSEAPRLRPSDDAARKRAAVETYARHEAVLRRTARRYSLCADDADDALQRALEILLRKAPTGDSRELIKWTQTVVKHEALAVRRERERILAGPAAIAPEPGAEDWTALLPTASDGPPELAERQEAIARSREALQTLKPQELRALTLLAEGYSYAEIGEITGYSRTKINRCLAEGRERFRKLISSGEDGSLCTEMRPLLSRFCDGETTPQEAGRLREHLRACPNCRATLRAYRAAPRAAALVPLVPLHPSPWERIQDAAARIAERFGGGQRSDGDAAVQLVTGAGAGGGGTTGFVKAAVVWMSAAGGVAACAATGLIPSPVSLPGKPDPAPQHRLAEARLGGASLPGDSAGVGDRTPPEVEKPSPQRRAGGHREVATGGTAPIAEAAPEASSSADYTPAPAPETVAEPTPEPAPPAPAETTGGNPAGEFGP